MDFKVELEDEAGYDKFNKKSATLLNAQDMLDRINEGSGSV